MYLSSLDLQNFRNYSKRTFHFIQGTTLIVGDNASGKTNILEAIHLLSTAKSFRAQRIEEMILYDAPLARVSGNVSSDLEGEGVERGEHLLEILLTRGEVQGRRVAKRRYSVDGAPKRYLDFVGRLAAVLFRPEDLQLILGSPQMRRAYLDDVLALVDREYRRSLVSYEKALARRNRLLDAIREIGVSRTQLAFWDQLLVKHGQMLTQKRRTFVDAINRFDLEIDSFQVIYDSSDISPARLEQYAQQEVAVGYTLVGPHKDDFQIVTSDTGQVTRTSRNLALYGSRGEQRLAVLWLKLAELSFVTGTIGERPLLLLDVILSELDHEHRRLVLKILPHQQTILTTTDFHLVGSTKGMLVVELR